jgi:hypothetical protein
MKIIYIVTAILILGALRHLLARKKSKADESRDENNQ